VLHSTRIVDTLHHQHEQPRSRGCCVRSRYSPRTRMITRVLGRTLSDRDARYAMRRGVLGCNLCTLSALDRSRPTGHSSYLQSMNSRLSPSTLQGKMIWLGDFDARGEDEDSHNECADSMPYCRQCVHFAAVSSYSALMTPTCCADARCLTACQAWWLVKLKVNYCRESQVPHCLFPTHHILLLKCNRRSRIDPADRAERK
jgi:hypothetical protein